MKPLVSILIPCHNSEKWIAETIKSALAQTWADKEIIVVDDGSTDNTPAIANNFESKAVKVLSQKRAGAASARNRAFLLSCGELIKFLDADDILSPQHIELQIEKIAGDSEVVASSEWGRFYNNIEETKFKPEKVWRDLQPVDWLVNAWEKAEPMMQPGIFLIPRKVLVKSGLWDERLSLIDDFEFFTRVILASKGVRFTSGAKLYYRSDLSHSLSGLQTRKGAESAFLSIQLATDRLLGAEYSHRTRLVCANIYQNFIYTFYPGHKGLLIPAVKKVIELGGSKLPFPGGPVSSGLSKVVGWEATKRLRQFSYRLGYRKVAIGNFFRR